MLLPLWWMELPHLLQADVITNVADGTAACVTADVIANCGRWNSHFCGWLMLLLIVADGIATWLECFPRQISLPWWQMLKPLGHYFSLSSVVLTRASSHM